MEVVDKYVFIDKTGKEVLKPQYDNISSFSDGIAPVRIGDSWYIINKKGEILVTI